MRTRVHSSLGGWADGDWLFEIRASSIVKSSTVSTPRPSDKRGETYALVTQATSGEKPSMWSFSRSRTFAETNMGKYEFCTSISLIFALNQAGRCALARVLWAN